MEVLVDGDLKIMQVKIIMQNFKLEEFFMIQHPILY